MFKIIHLFVFQGRADGNTCALWLRLHLQRHLYSLGCFLQLHCGKVLFLGLLLLSLCCVGLKTAHIETNVEELWVEGESISLSLLPTSIFFSIFKKTFFYLFFLPALLFLSRRPRNQTLARCLHTAVSLVMCSSRPPFWILT